MSLNSLINKDGRKFQGSKPKVGIRDLNYQDDSAKVYNMALNLQVGRAIYSAQSLYQKNFYPVADDRIRKTSGTKYQDTPTMDFPGNQLNLSY